MKVSKDENCQIDDDCSSGTCAPVSPFSKEGVLFLIFIAALLIALFLVLFYSGYIWIILVFVWWTSTY